MTEFSKYKNNLIITEILRFIVVGVLATVIHYFIYIVLQNIISVNIAYTIGYVISFCSNFWLTARFTFKTDATVKRGMGFAISHLINYCMQMIILNISIGFDIPATLAPIAVLVICVPIQFLLIRFVFKNR